MGRSAISVADCMDVSRQVDANQIPDIAPLWPEHCTFPAPEALMRFNIAACVLVGLGTIAAVTAQQPADGQTVNVTGCLQRAQRDGSAGGTVVGTSASPATADDDANSGALVDAYLLTEATPTASASTTTGAATGSAASNGTTGTTATGTTGTRPTAYGLVGHEAELSEHTGARIEVTGTVVPPATSGHGAGGAAAASGVKRVRVTSMKVLADSCSAK
jgi:hypothetical protein